ncbi:probable bat1-branched chain amino acid mitochondrial [Ceraceosorus bombacis]|uniref:Branched-chain-amino-acid aminotransferase n=1 Tax=Ceraceosorus bombacis TaxID=401625 RepID=A0A0P1BEG7_9BASI|nr:probable bat1-branched chain amino acid mitochondrial [Ceraceosorus bombacis]
MAPALDLGGSSASISQARLKSTTTTTTGPAGKIEAAQDPLTGESLGSSRPLDASALILERTKSAKKPPPSHELVFGHCFSDHMLSVDWSSSRGWSSPKIQPYGPFTLDPSSVIFHYAPSLFEGMKAYKDVNGEVRLFRPDMNMKRMNTSAERLALPTFSHGDLIKLIATLVDLDSSWIPSEPGHSLYIRPALIGTQAALGVHPTTDARLFVISSPVGPYYKTGFKPVALEADPSKVRAWPGGTGNYKLGGNYAPGIRPQMEAATRGYQQNLWLFGDEHWLTEVGTMNLFVALRQSDGSVELVTPPLNGMILPGVTRDSILGLAREHSSGSTQPLEGVAKELKVSEREINMAEIQKAASEGALLEIFGAGTAAVVSPVDRIGYMGKDVHIPVGPSGAGPIAKAMLERINDIQLGRIEHPWSVRVKDIVDNKV